MTDPKPARAASEQTSAREFVTHIWDMDAPAMIEAVEARDSHIKHLEERIERVRALFEEFDNLTILGSDEKKAGYEAAMRTAVIYLRAALSEE